MTYSSIADARNDLGLSQEDMASELGMCRQTYSKIEKNIDGASVGELRKICAILAKRYSDVIFAQMVSFNSPS